MGAGLAVQPEGEEPRGSTPGVSSEDVGIELKKHNLRLRIAPDAIKSDEGFEGLSLPEVEGVERSAERLLAEVGKQVSAGRLRVHATRDGEIYVVPTDVKDQLSSERTIAKLEREEKRDVLGPKIQEALFALNDKAPSLEQLFSRTELFWGPGSRDLTELVAAHLGIQTGKLMHRNFGDGEYKYPSEDSVQSKDVVALMSCYGPSQGDRFDRFKTIIEGIERASCRSITAVMPYYPFARQDRRTGDRDPITARRVADELVGVGVSRLITIDLHNLAIEGFFPPTVPVTNLSGAAVLAPYLQENFLKGVDLEDVVAVSPDFGGDKRTAEYVRMLGLENSASIEKRRNKDDEIEAMKLHGDVRGKIAIIFDDLVDSGGTIVNAEKLLRSGHDELVFHDGKLVPRSSAGTLQSEEVAAQVELLLAAGAKKVVVCASHAVLSNNAVERLEKSGVDSFVFLDTIPFAAHPKNDRWHQVSAAPLIAAAMTRLRAGASLSELQGEVMPYSGGVARSGVEPESTWIESFAELLSRAFEENMQ